jgi:ubiquitin fusion degradation protein 1
MEVQYPLTFEIVTNQKKTHCGVLEFTSDEGACFIPHWIMNNLEIKDGDMIYIRNVDLNQATFVKFKPCLTFLEISDPRVVLEYTLRSFSCLTIGDKLHFDYNFKTYCLEVIELLPKKACCIIEADIEVEFDEPDGYVKEIKESNKIDQTKKIDETNEIKEPKKIDSQTKWSKLSKIAHFQGVGNKLK